MGSKRSVEPVVAVLLVLVLGVLAAAGQQVATPSTSEDCSTLVLGMADCLTFVTSGSTVNKPEGQCCPGLKSVLRTDAQCLCDAFKNSASFGVQLNMTKALTLPAACHVSAPSAKTCGMSLSPAGAPVSAIGSPTSAEEPASSSMTDTPAASPGGFGATEMSPSPAQGANGSPSLILSFFSLGLTMIALTAASSIILSSY